MVATKFVNGEEALRHFVAQGNCDVDLEKFQHRELQKIWTGQIMGIYRWEEGKLSPTILSKLKVTDIGYGNTGAHVRLLNLTTGQTMDVGYVPKEVFGFDIAVCAPNRIMIERTIQIRSDNTTSYGTRAGLLVMHPQDPASNVGPIDILESWYQVKNRFEHTAAFDKELRNLQRRVCL